MYISKELSSRLLENNGLDIKVINNFSGLINTIQFNVQTVLIV